MATDAQLLNHCRREIEDQLGWGPADRWTTQDFERLGERIQEHTGVALSATTLKRVWGRVAYRSQPSTTTLDALAAFAGYDHWRALRSQTPPPPPPPQTPPPRRYPRIQSLYWLLPSLLIAGLLVLLLNVVPNKAPASAPPQPASASAPTPTSASASASASYSLNLRPVTTGVPNSVVFTYDARAAPTDSVYLQQDWDPSRRQAIDPDGDTYTSIYYLPGFYQAKLVVGDEIVREREVFIRSDDWVGLAQTEPVPTYLPTETIHQDDRLQITAEDLAALGISLSPTPPRTVLTHVGGLQELYTDNFTFRTRLRHDYAAGSGACQHTRIILLLKNSAIVVPLSAPGCVAELNLYAGGHALSGRTNDLSAFGAVDSSFLEVECTGRDDLLTFRIDGRPVLQLENTEGPREIIGIRYEFAGAGTVDEVWFGNAGGAVWEGV